MSDPACCICRGLQFNRSAGAINVFCDEHQKELFDPPVHHMALEPEKPKLRDYTSAERKAAPLWSILSSYFPDAFMALARHSKKANDKHNPGEPLGWARHKSFDHLECAARHLLTPDVIDADTGEIELVGAFWRIGAALQLREEKRLVAAGIKPLSGVVDVET